jgi:hypothetical protein
VGHGSAGARREGSTNLAEEFRVRALGTATVIGTHGLGGFFVVRSDAPLPFGGLIGGDLPVIVLSALTGMIVLLLAQVGRDAPLTDRRVVGGFAGAHRVPRWGSHSTVACLPRPAFARLGREPDQVFTCPPAGR